MVRVDILEIGGLGLVKKRLRILMKHPKFVDRFDVDKLQ